jgi:hypothetical protein
MKIQDILFFIILIFLVLKSNQKWTTIAGLISIVFAIPLFGLHIFFTAERLTWYAAAFFLISIFLILRKSFYENRN